MSRKTDHVHITELAGEHRLSRRPVASVEPPLKADLDERARLLYMLDDRMGGCQVEGDGLLAEGRHACVGGHVEELGMDGRRRRDDERVYAFTGQRFDACRLLGAQRFGDARCPLGVRIDHGEPRYERALLQGLRMQRADATDAHHPDVHFPLLGAQRSASPQGDRDTLPARNDDTICVDVNDAALSPRIGVVTEAFADRPLVDVMDWLVNNAPSVSDLEIGTGGYAPTGHCDMPLLLRDSAARNAWFEEIATRGLG